VRGAAGERPRGPLPHHAGTIFYYLVESISSLLLISKIYCYVNVRFLFVRQAHGIQYVALILDILVHTVITGQIIVKALNGSSMGY
jgi:hypothetical protein